MLRDEEPDTGRRDEPRERGGGTQGPVVLTVRDARCRLAADTAASTGATKNTDAAKNTDGADGAASGNGRLVFDGIGLDIQAGRIVDLVGPSGSGKSSLLTCMAQLNPRATATLTLHGRPASDFTMQQWRHHVAYLPQKSTLFGQTVAEAIRFPFTLGVAKQLPSPDDAAIRSALNAVGLADIELTRDPHDLSGGQSARVSMLRSILTKPDVLLADEVDAGLDDDTARLVAVYMARTAHDTGMAIVRVRHRPPDGMADCIATLADGRLTMRDTASSRAMEPAASGTASGSASDATSERSAS
ncbi:ATP-binding cassette domain-containing protein [Pseudoscardovia radai]|uniref:ABC transporter ATP-binding protein n=1 Tax=Pseudoscardovia radai TaxID=987066 RepID=UPI003994B572